MIVQETTIINGKEFRRTYSDVGCYVERDGVEYSEAIDPIDSNRQYIETDKLIDEDDNAAQVDNDIATINDYRAALVELGVKL